MPERRRDRRKGEEVSSGEERRKGAGQTGKPAEIHYSIDIEV